MARADRRFRMVTHRSAGAFIAFALVLGCMSGLACAARAVAGEAAGYVAENAFFTGGLGDDAELRKGRTEKGGSRKGDEPGLYGGSRDLDVCDTQLLLEFLLNAANVRKKTAWAKALGISARNKKVRQFVGSLTEVLLAGDTLVANHGYRKGRANRYDAVLEAGTAVLVDLFGVPRVKCNCGNPLAVSGQDPGDVDVEFKNRDKGNRKWHVRKDRVVRVEKADEKQKSLVVVDVDDPDQQIPLPLPTDPDTKGPDKKSVTVPAVRGMTESEATEALTGLGLTVETERVDVPEVGTGLATGTDPADGTTVPAGSTVTLMVSGTATEGLVDVPSVIGMPQEEAEQLIYEAGLQPAVALQGASADQVGLVIDQDPEGGQVEPGSTVSLTVGEETTTTTDGGVDGGTDEGADGGTDAGADGGADAGTDAGTDAGADAGTDTGAAVP
ncbi:PASTA domain-containing protein [Streptomyces apricus]|uniref:PASTA domain-containing protein n=2 Tax=Streptomyces apricus TaxID=1828112 RepID=A0A5B0BL54_9ACTN|nr:PASTA domain-containing protein [Streptomyces apricus]